jgi:nitrous oxidase accessory protein
MTFHPGRREKARNTVGGGLFLSVMVAALVSIGCSNSQVASESSRFVFASPARPATCQDVPAGSSLQEALDAAQPGSSFCLAPGEYPAPLRIPAGVSLWGPRSAVVRSPGRGSTVHLEGQGARLLGLTVDGSGRRFDTLDAAVRVRGEEVVVEGVRIQNATFGILVDRSKRVVLRGNLVIGTGGPALGMRGDAIRLWETQDSLVEGNHVEGSRDMVVWYSSGNRMLRNIVRGGRYGTHLMYSHGNLLEDNSYLGNEVGIFLMYSRNITMRRNLFANATGAAGIGLGLKESGNIAATDNRFIHNTMGLYLDNSPLQKEDANLFEGNLFRLGEAGVVFHSSPHRNTFRGNSFRDNHVSVQVEGGGDAREITWHGNDFDDYAGYDLDGDGVGDVPYELRSLSGELVSNYPDLAFFRGTPSLALVRAAGELIPLFAPRTLLRDEAPRMRALSLEDTLDAN